MDLRQVVEGYFVSPQLTPSDMATLAAMGVTTVICNRPDREVPPDLQAAALQEAAEAAGLSFVYNPVIGLDLPMDAVEEQAETISSADGKVVGYCGSGMRSAVMWAFAMAGEKDARELMKIIAAAGYQIDHLEGLLEGLAEARS